MIPGTQLADVAGGGMSAALGILLALQARERSGEGQYVDISMTDGVMGMMGYAATFWWMAGQKMERGRSMLTGRYPVVPHLPLRRRPLPLDRRRRARASGRCSASTSAGPSGARASTTRRRSPRCTRSSRRASPSAARDAWFEELRPLAVCVAPVLDVEEAFDSEHARVRGLVAEVDVDGRPLRVLGVPIKLSADAGPRRAPPAPLRRAHRRGAGRARPRPPAIAELRAKGVAS